MNRRYDISDFVSVRTEQSVLEDLALRFRARRKEMGITQKELAQTSGVTYASIRRFENTGEIALSRLLRLSNVLGVLTDIDTLFKDVIKKDIRP